jgi:transcription-repair coupling factor (superfamily II helicase)
MDRLGAGFAISARDLDLRGAGELMGEQQAGPSPRHRDRAAPGRC